MKLGLKSCLMLFLLSIGSFGAPASDFRLIRAVQNKDTEAVLSLLKQHVDVNSPGPDGATALAWAVHWDDLNTTNLLIGAGAKLNAANDNGVTPLWLACYNGSGIMVERLLEAGADPNASSLPAGETALLRCAGTGSLDAVKSLLAHGADVNAKEKAEQTALMWALEERHPEVARVLIEHGADVNAISQGGFTPLLFAARQGDVDSGRLLLEKGADLNVRNAYSGRPARPTVAFSENTKGLQWFTRRSPEPMDALSVAINSGREQFAIFLAEQGANTNAVDNRGMTALHYALMQGISDLNNVPHDPRSGALDFLFRPNMAELVKVLLDHGANPNARISKRLPPLTNNDQPKISLTGATPFLLAAATGDVKIMKLLLTKGADPLLTTDDGTTPLMAAAGISRSEDRTREEEKNALEALKLTVEMGGDVNAANKNGFTALHGAAYTGANEIVQYLADRGAKLDAMNKFGETPLSTAAGDPNGLVGAGNGASQPVHESTEALLRKLISDRTVSVNVTPEIDISTPKLGH